MLINNPQHFITLMGDSAVGKNTLIRNILNPQHSARKSLNIGIDIQAFGPSYQPLELSCQSKHDYNLYQWQKVDGISHIQKLRQTFPSAKHIIYLLWRPLDSPRKNTWIWDYLARPAVQKVIGHGSFHPTYTIENYQTAKRILLPRWKSLINEAKKLRELEYDVRILDCRDYTILDHFPTEEPKQLSNSGHYQNFTIDDNFQPQTIQTINHTAKGAHQPFLIPGDTTRTDTNARLIQKWHILQPYYPLLRNKQVVDVGASTGFFSSQAAAIGATSVLAIEEKENKLLNYVASIYHSMRFKFGIFPDISQECDWMLLLAVTYALKLDSMTTIKIVHELCQEGCIIELCEDYKDKIGQSWTKQEFESNLWSIFDHCYLIGTTPGNKNLNNAIRYIYVALKHAELGELLQHAHQENSLILSPS